VSRRAATSQLVLNADDFGYSDDTVAATIDCFTRGALTSATIMATMPAAPRAIAYARAHPEFSFGAHLTFTGSGLERPCSDPRDIPALVDADGQFMGTDRIVAAAFLRRLPLDQIRREAEAQLGFLRDHGVRLSHVDSHGHVHKFASFVDALRVVLPRFGVGRVRRGQNVWIKRPLRSPTFWVGGAWHPPIRKYFRTTERLFMPICESDATRAEEVLHRRWRGRLEVGLHPGSDEPWRLLEAEAATRIAAAAPGEGWTLSTWNDL